MSETTSHQKEEAQKNFDPAIILEWLGYIIIIIGLILWVKYLLNEKEHKKHKKIDNEY